jgi:hypothetical protein
VRFDVLDAPLAEALLLARGVILGVLAEIAMLRASAIAWMMRGRLFGLEPFQLDAQALGTRSAS